MEHSEMCIWCANGGAKEECPFTKPMGGLKDFIIDEFTDPLKAAKGVIYGILIGAGLWLLIAMAWVI